MPTAIDTHAQASAELLRDSVDWLWECDLAGRVTRLTPGRAPLPVGLADSFEFPIGEFKTGCEYLGPISFNIRVNVRSVAANRENVVFQDINAGEDLS